MLLPSLVPVTQVAGAFSCQRIAARLSSTLTSFSPSPSSSGDDLTELILRQESPLAALEIFRWASRLPSFKPSPATNLILVRRLAASRRFDDAWCLLAQDIPRVTGSAPDDDTLVAFIRGLGVSRLPQEAFQFPDKVVSHLGTKPSPRVLHCILDVLVKEDIDLARAFLRRKMAPWGVRVNARTVGVLMKGLCRTNRIEEGFKLLKLAKAAGFGGNPVIYNTLIHALCRNGKAGRARSLMAQMETPSAVTLNILVSAYCAEGDTIRALVMLEKYFDLCLVPDVITVTKLVTLLCNQGRVMDAMEVMERVENKGGILDVVCYNKLIEGFCELGKPMSGLRVVREMELKGKTLPDSKTYNVLIRGFCKSAQVDSAMDLFREMESVGVNKDFETFDVLIRGFCTVGRVADGIKLLDMLEERNGGLLVNIEPYNSILYGLYRASRMDESYGLLGKLWYSFPRVVGRSMKILSFCQTGQVTEAKELFDQMVLEGDVPNILIHASLVHCFCEGHQSREAFDLMNEMIEKGYLPLISMYNDLIDGFRREGKVGTALKLLEEMHRRGHLPESACYGTIHSALCKELHHKRACNKLLEMV